MAVTHTYLIPPAEIAASVMLIDTGGATVVDTTITVNGQPTRAFDITGKPINIAAMMAAGWTVTTQQV
jgi:hypothetical protein